MCFVSVILWVVYWVVNGKCVEEAREELRKSGRKEEAKGRATKGSVGRFAKFSRKHTSSVSMSVSFERHHLHQYKSNQKKTSQVLHKRATEIYKMELEDLELEKA